MTNYLFAVCLVLTSFVAAASGQVLPSPSKNASRYGSYNSSPNSPLSGRPLPTASALKKSGPPPFQAADYLPGRVLIKMASASKAMALKEQDTKLSALSIIKMERLFPRAQAPSFWQMLLSPQGKGLAAPDLTLWYRATLPQDADVLKTVQELQKEPDIAWAEPDYLRQPLGLPADRNGTAAVFPRGAVAADPVSDQQWHLAAARVPEARAYLASQGKEPGGSRDVVVAVIDTGVDYTHPDLAANMWINGRETPGNGDDDDGNDYVDDVFGVNLVANSGDPMDDNGHGTHVAGIIAAAANDVGGEGVAYNVRIMSIKAAQASGGMAISDIVKGIEYAVTMGADIINMSFGGYTRSQAEEDVLSMARGQAVLVAAAGNDGKVNLPGPGGVDMYPAAYNWVLGVMAADENGERSPWSNYDYAPRDLDEYELLAPGAGIWSTLPGDQYSSWSGTSMAAAVVSGVAALVRTQFPDKATYSPGFIMGQIVKSAAAGLDAQAALATPPQADLAYQQHYSFDPDNPDDNKSGPVIAGATIDLGLVIRNHWGQADQVSVKLEAMAEGASQPDQYITMIMDTVAYGNIGSFGWQDNGLIKDGDGVVTGVQNPFRFQVSTDTPDNYPIPFKLTLTAKNGLAPNDTTIYTYTSRFSIPVQRGRALPSVISQDTTLTKDYLWIVAGPVLVQPGVTLTIEPGTQVQWGPSSNSAYEPHLVLNGSLIAQGTNAEPIKLSGLYVTDGDYYKSVIIYNRGRITLQYFEARNLTIHDNGSEEETPVTLDHGYIYDSYSVGYCLPKISNCLFKINDPSAINTENIDTCLIDNTSSYYSDGYSNIGYQAKSIHDTVFLQNNKNNNPLILNVYQSSPDIASATAATSFIRNAFLSKYWDEDPAHWMRIRSVEQDPSIYCGVTNNYWGTTSTSLIDQVIYDFADDFYLSHVVYQPILTTPAETTYPFVVDCVIRDKNGQVTEQVGAEVATFTLTYNRDMDTSVQPQVTFGPKNREYTLYNVTGDWQDARTWVGTFDVTPVTGDGYQYLRIVGGRAASDPWLICGEDVERFRFQIVTSGTIAMRLQAEVIGGEVQLNWAQNDFSLLAGYNMYRATSASGEYERINPSVIPRQTTYYVDKNVQAGQSYYYKFTVVSTSQTESNPSDVVQVTIPDTDPPVISHTPATHGAAGQPISLSANVTDNVAVKNVTLHFRQTGTSAYTDRPMVNVSGSKYVATIEGSLVTSAGVDYYISASDGRNTAITGSENTPYQIITVQLNITASAGTNGSISPAGEVKVNYGDSQTFTITPNAHCHVVDVLVDGISVGLVTSYTFDNVTTDHTISASFAMDTFTLTAYPGDNGSISPGSATVNYGGNQTFTITPATHYHITDVLVDGVSVGAKTKHTFTNVTADHTISANFAIDTFTITASAGTHGSISPEGEVNLNAGDGRIFYITPDSGYHVADVLVDGKSVGKVTNYTFENVTANHTIAASFAIDTFTITATAEAHGKITPASAKVKYLGSKTFNIIPDANYHVADVFVDGYSVGAVTSYTFSDVTGDHTIAASFAINTFTIAATAGDNGSIDPGSATVDYGGSQTFTITPAANYHVADVLVDGKSVGKVTSYTFKDVIANHTISASFAIDTFTITATPGAHGKITPKSAKVNYGDSKTFKIIPAANYHVAEVLVDGYSVGAVDSYTFNGVTGDHTITATFALDTFTITATAGENGSIFPNSATVDYGGKQTFSITPNTHYRVADVLVDGKSVGAVTSYTFENVSANHTLYASFAIKTFTITATAGAHGAISPPGKIKVNSGDGLAFEITPDTGYHVADVLVDGTSVGARTSYSFSDVTANHTIAASFAIDTFTITAAAGDNGRITPKSAKVKYGGSKTFKIIPAANYHVADVFVDGYSVGAVTSHTFNNVTGNHTITAYFAINTYTIAATAEAHGAIYPPGEVNLNYGDGQTFYLTPDTGYHVADVLVDGISVGAVTSYTFNNVAADHTIKASFAIDTFTITTAAEKNGRIAPKSAKVKYGGSKTFTIIPATGYHVADVLVDGYSVGPVTSYTFSDVTGNHTIAASFAKNSYTIIAAAGPGGTISPSGEVQVNYGVNRKFTIKASSGYDILDVIVDGTSVGPVASYIFMKVSADHTIEATFQPQSTNMVTDLPSPINIVTDKDTVYVPKGRSVILRVKLDAAPAADVAVDTVKTGGTDAIGLQGNTSFTFTPTNWNTYQSLELTASASAKDVNREAQIAFTNPSLATKNVTAVKVNKPALEGILELLLDRKNGPGGADIKSP